MPEIALHILDLVQNSIAAGATRVVVTIAYDTGADALTILIEDDGRGMGSDFLSTVTSPFATTRTTRKVGLGIPLFKQLAEMCGGDFAITSAPGAGTALRARFRASHVDLPPLGNLPDTLRVLIAGAPDTDVRFVYRVDDREFALDTAEIRAAIFPAPLGDAEVLAWIGGYLAEGMQQVERPE